MNEVDLAKVKIQRFEELLVWQKARELTRGIYLASARGKFARDFGLRDQLRRSAVSVMANIAEGFERGGRGEFHQFLSMAKGSSGETRSSLYVARDAGYLSHNDFAQLLKLAEEIGRMLGRMRRTVQSQRNAK
ncbi:MAG TPA: four helix bundle protein [Gemmatimonadales bacterium]|nr:four helix bundle protein [Gemmatimonadales bacterium]